MEHFVSFDGTRIAFGAEGTGNVALLLHGFAADAVRNWVRPGIVAALVGAGRRVVAYDARGHGASDKPHDPAAYEHDAMVRDAQALLDHLGITAPASVDVVGYSMGAIVSSKLVPVEPRARSLVLGGVGGRLAAGRSPASRARTADALQSGAGRRVTDPLARSFRRFAEMGGNDLDALAALQRAASAGRPGDLGAIGVPTLVVAGSEDRLAGAPEPLAARIAGARALTVPGNHLSAVGRPELTAAIVTFLAEVSPAGR